MIESYEQLCNALFSRLRACDKAVGVTPADLEARKAWHLNDPESQRVSALIRLFHDALDEAELYGYVGVGKIDFAEERLRRAQEAK